MVKFLFYNYLYKKNDYSIIRLISCFNRVHYCCPTNYHRFCCHVLKRSDRNTWKCWLCSGTALVFSSAITGLPMTSKWENFVFNGSCAQEKKRRKIKYLKKKKKWKIKQGIKKLLAWELDLFIPLAIVSQEKERIQRYL